jgi:uncharacterized SAM-binding protein YcdF (DUF218 family)/lysophospholipase L1-like esterase
LAFLLGIASVYASRWIVNRSAFPDRLIAPLLVRDTSGPADVIVVPAASVTAVCSANLNSLRRTILAARLYREGRAPRVLFSGGYPRSGPHCHVATVMAEFALQLGVPASAITTETASTTTWENAERSHPLLQALGAHRILLVTDRLHQVRAAASFRRFGYAIEHASVPVFEGHRDNVDMLQMGLREFVALRVYQARGWIADPWTRDPQPASAPAAGAVPSPAPTAMQSMSRIHPDGPLVILGASYAGGWPVKSLAGVPVVNRGVAGQQSFELLARFDADVVAQKPRAVILWGFINDVHRAPRDRIDAAVAKARTTFEQMVARARANGIEPILTTELTIRPPAGLYNSLMSWAGWLLGKTSYQDMVNRHVIATNQWIRDFGGREKLLVLDIHPVLSEAGGARRAAFAIEDGSHVSAAGYAALTAYAEPVLTSHFRRP